jgi:hypothetical protein
MGEIHYIDGRVELAHRNGEGLDVQLLWCRRTDTATVVVRDERTPRGFVALVHRDLNLLEPALVASANSPGFAGAVTTARDPLVISPIRPAVRWLTLGPSTEAKRR